MKGSTGTRVAEQLDVRVRAVARRDIAAAATHLQEAAGTATGHRFVRSVREAVAHLQRFPNSGSPRIGALVNIEGLRLWPVPGLPHVIVYMSTEGLIDVWRVLHGRRDLPGLLGTGSLDAQ